MNDKFVNAVLTAATEEGRKAFMKECQAEQTAEDCLGIALAHHFKWDGTSILEVAASALEDANFHAEAAAINKMLEKYEMAEVVTA